MHHILSTRKKYRINELREVGIRVQSGTLCKKNKKYEDQTLEE
jgi:hypothetical protein